MTVKLQGAAPPPSPEAISAVESELALKLPSAYVEALAFCNGAKPEPNILKGREQSYMVVRFLRLEELPYHKSLLDQLNPSGNVPIAESEGGNYICIATDKVRAGAILFADHEIPGDGAFTPICDTLDGFLQHLMPFHIEDVELPPGQVGSVWIRPGFLKELGLEE